MFKKLVLPSDEQTNAFLLLNSHIIAVKNGTYASMLPQKSRTFPSVSGMNRNMPKRLANQI